MSEILTHPLIIVELVHTHYRKNFFNLISSKHAVRLQDNYPYEGYRLFVFAHHNVDIDKHKKNLQLLFLSNYEMSNMIL